MSSERYTVVLTGRYNEERSYLAVNEDGDHEHHPGRPPVERLRGEISFDDLPVAVKEEVLKVYREMWGL